MGKNLPDPAKGLLSLCGAASIIGSYGIFVVWVSEVFGVATQNLIRFGGSWLIMVAVTTVTAWVAAKHKPSDPIFKRLKQAIGLGKLRDRREKAHVLIVGVLGLGTVLFFTLAITQGDAEVATVIAVLYATMNVFAFLFGKIIFKDVVTRTMVVSACFAGAGLMLTAGEGLLLLTTEVWFAVAAGICDAASNMSRKHLGGEIGAVATAFWQYTLAVPILLLVVLVLAASGLEQPIHFEALTGTAVMAMLGYTMVTSVLSVLIAYGSQHRALGGAAVVLSSQILFAALFAFLFFGQVPEALAWVGFIFLSASAFAASKKGTRNLAVNERTESIPVD